MTASCFSKRATLRAAAKSREKRRQDVTMAKPVAPAARCSMPSTTSSSARAPPTSPGRHFGSRGDAILGRPDRFPPALDFDGVVQSIVTGSRVAGRFGRPSTLRPIPTTPGISSELQFAVREPPSRTSPTDLVYDRQPIQHERPLLMPENGVIFSDGIEADRLDFDIRTEVENRAGAPGPADGEVVVVHDDAIADANSTANARIAAGITDRSHCGRGTGPDRPQWLTIERAAFERMIRCHALNTTQNPFPALREVRRLCRNIPAVPSCCQ